MQGDSGILGQPLPDLVVFVGVVVVQHDVQLAAGVGLGDLLQEVEELGLAVPLVARSATLPVATSNAANRVVVPCRT